jgi:hypothetical protein
MKSLKISKRQYESVIGTQSTMAKRKDKMSKNDPQNITQETRD